MIARLVRVEQSDQGALGVLLLGKEVMACTLEPDSNEKGKLYIPQGSYDCFRFHGPKWPDTFEIRVQGHSAVLFHAGNVEAETLGCVLLGSSFGKLKGQRAVLNSGATFKDFLERTVGLDHFTLFVQDCYQ